MSDITLTIDGKKVTVPKDSTILDAAKKLGVRIPTLCYHERLHPIASCRMCVVEIEGCSRPMTACDTLVTEGISVTTDSERLFRIRQESLKLILVNHPLDCPVCDKAGECTLQDLVYEFGIDKVEYQLPKQERKSEYATSLIRYWPDRCIMCLRCVTACREVKAVGAIDITGDGYGAQVITVDPEKCKSCGECLQVCPTGALTENLSRYKGRPWLINRVNTTCTYCGCGCQTELNVHDKQVIAVTACEDSGVNRGSLCVRGRFGYKFINSSERLTKPLVRRNGQFQETDWNDALRLVAKRFNQIKKEQGSDAIGGIASAHLTNEEGYIFQKFFRTVIGTNNIDNSAGLYMSPGIEGLQKVFGPEAVTNPIADLLKADVILAVGTDITETNPVFANYLKKAVLRRGTKLIVADPVRTDIADFCDVWLRPMPGTDAAWIGGLMHQILKSGLQDSQYMESRTEGFEDFRKTLETCTPEYVSGLTGISSQQLETAARLYAESDSAVILYGMGVACQAGSRNTIMLLGDLSLMCGNADTAGCGLIPLSIHNNARGMCDVGVLPDVLSGYRSVESADGRKEISTLWGKAKLPSGPGMTMEQMFESSAAGRLKAMYIMGDDPVLTCPDAVKASNGLKALDFLVVQDVFMTETAEKADVVLPAVTFAEKQGSFTNAEGMVQKVTCAVEPSGECREGWWAVSELAEKMGVAMDVAGPEQVIDEIKKIIPGYVLSDDDDVQDGARARVRGEGKAGCFVCVDFKALREEKPDSDYPLVLNSATSLSCLFGGLEASGLAASEGLVLQVNSRDAEKAGLKDDSSVKMVSRSGSVKLTARLTDRLPEGMVFLPRSSCCSVSDVLSGCDNGPAARTSKYMSCPVRLERAN